VAVASGLTARQEHVVTSDDTAIALGSGDVPVLATPRLVAWVEAATVAAVSGALDPATTTVGTRVEAEHLLATPVGAAVEVRARLDSVDGRTLVFVVEAADGPRESARTVFRGQVTRVMVDRDRFLARLP
jgi:predicted thioesterase